MSQAGVLDVAGSTPSIPTSFTTDSGNVAIPFANNINIFGTDTTEDNLLGIQTTVTANLSDNLYVVLTNRLSGAISTNDATPTAIITFDLGASAAVYTLNGVISGFNTTDVAGGSYFFTAGVRTDGAAATEIGVEFTSEFEEVSMSSSDVTVSVSGNNLVITVIGIALKTISWLSQCNYSKVG